MGKEKEKDEWKRREGKKDECEGPELRMRIKGKGRQSKVSKDEKGKKMKRKTRKKKNRGR